MTIGVLVTASCILTSITMLIFSAALFVLIQSGSSAAQTLVSRLLGFGRDRDDDEKPKEATATARARSEVSSGDVLRQRAQQLDFVPQAAVPTFNAQSMPQQATFSSRDPLAMPQQNVPFGQPQQAQFGPVNPAMPTLSSARPYQAGQQPLGGQTQYGQAPQYGQPLGGQPTQYGQQPTGNTSQQFRPQTLGGQTQYGQTSPLGQQPLGNQPQQYGQQPLGGQTPQYGQPPISGQPTYNPQQGQYGQPPLGGQRPPLGNQPQQYGQQPLGGQPTYNPQQYGQPPLGNQPPAQNPLGNYAPPPRSRASANIDDQNTSPSSGLRSRRDSRRSDRDEIYDDSQGGIGGIIDDLGNLIP